MTEDEIALFLKRMEKVSPVAQPAQTGKTQTQTQTQTRSLAHAG